MNISSEHAALLRACLSDQDFFEINLRDWEQIQDIETIDYATMRLIPYLYRKTLSYSVHMRDEGICKGLYLRAWYLLQTQGVPSEKWVIQNMDVSQCILLKGAALQKSIYSEDLPTRPTDDLDLLVRPGYVEKSFEILHQAGFSSDSWLSPEGFRRLRHGGNFYGNGLNVDLHWQLIPVSLDPGYTSRLFERASKLSSGISVLSPTDNLFHTLVHGFGANEIAPIRWVVDAAELIGREQIDWQLFWCEVGRTGMHKLVEAQVKTLESFGVSVPKVRGVRMRTSLPISVSVLFLRTEGRYLRRVLRLLGYDFAVWAQHAGVTPSTLNYYRHLSRWLANTRAEWKEYRSAKA